MSWRIFRTALPYTAGLGGIAGLVWGFALDVDLITALVVGLAVGLVVGAILGVVNVAAYRDGKLQPGEVMAVSGMILGLLSLMSIGLGLVVWLIRLIL